MKSALLQPGILVNETENEDQLGGKTPLWSTSWKFSFKKVDSEFCQKRGKKEKKRNKTWSPNRLIISQEQNQFTDFGEDHQGHLQHSFYVKELTLLKLPEYKSRRNV